MTHVDKANAYIAAVLSGEIPASKWVRLACERQRDDLLKPPGGYRFDHDRAGRVCRFIEMLPHIKGEWAGQPLKLEPWQCFVLTTAFGWVGEDGRRRFKTVYIEVPRKNGKALALDTPIPTPSGWRTMAEIAPGDYVFGQDGRPVKVVAATDVMRDRQCYEVSFSTGETIVADAMHLWETDARSDRDRLKGRGGKTKGPKPSIKTTEQIYNTLKCRNENNHRIRISGPVQFTGQDLPIDPYVLGAWLGDGTSAAGSICIGDQDKEEISRILADCGHPVRHADGCTYRFGDGDSSHAARSNSLAAKLRALGVLNNKHVPYQYMTASVANRMALLQGLMDTDGTCSKAGQCTFTNTKKSLAVSVHMLANSLGIKATIREGVARLNGKIVSAKWDVSFFAYDDTPVFRLERKKARQKKRPQTESRSSHIVITGCVPVNSVPVKCIEVDSTDGLFLCGRTFITTHNSALSSGVALYMLAADGEGGAEVYSAATTRDQARIVWDDAKRMVERSEGLRGLGVGASAHAIHKLNTASTFKALSRDQGGNLDGLNVHCAIVDELHAHKTRDVWDVLETATGARRQPMLWAITTAGFNRAGVCFEVRTYLQKILSGSHDDPEFFGCVWGIDDTDKWDDPTVWQKANPNWGISVKPDDIARKARKAMEMAAATNNFLTKHLNVWVNADTAWMDMRKWSGCEDDLQTLDEFEGCPCWIGIDLASKIDIAEVSVVFERAGNLHVFNRHYLNEDAVEDGRNSQYQGWAGDGRLTVTPGNVTDYAYIEDDLVELVRRFNIRAIGYDPWQAVYLANRLTEKGLPMVEVRQTVQNMSEPMKYLQAMVYSGKLRHDGDPVLSWMVSNVVAHLDAKENIYPRKQSPENKIDGVVALIMALGRYINERNESEVDISDWISSPVIR